MNIQKVLFTFLLLVPFFGVAQQKTHVPDDDFEFYLYMLGCDDDVYGNDSVWTSAIDTITSLGFPWSDYKGIEDFVSLKYFNCDNNSNLTILDLSTNVNLETISCWYTNVNRIIVNGCSVLQVISCQDSKIDSIDISNNPLLWKLRIPNNPLESLDVSNNLDLRYLSLGNDWKSPISVDITNNSELDFFSCTGAQNLVKVDARNGNNTMITHFNLLSNPNLECVLVDDSVYTVNNPNWYFDDVNLFRENCTTSVGLEEYENVEEDRILMKIVDILGREINPVPNVLLFYLYKDGTVEKKLIIE
tara:strand:+ start:128 stop:1036 length:909 start_codon:yes stop_codon:yes gene_type:complete